jgi:ornithine decarboxylase
LQDNFYVVDLGALQRLYRAWREAMPRVHPHYAVK